MKKIIFVLAIFVGFNSLRAQDASAISSAKEIVWYGLDFSKAKMIGDVGSKAQVIKDKHIPSWNRLVAQEPQNFPLKAELNNEIYYDLNPVDKINSTIDVSTMESFNKVNTDLDKSTLESMIKNYSLGDKKDGIGLVYVVMDLNKANENSTVYAVFFDIASHKILASKKFTGMRQGVGFRNYWAGCWKDIIKQMGKNYSYWK